MIHTPEHIKKMRTAAKTVSTVITEVSKIVAPRVALNTLDIEAAKIIDKLGATPFNLNYKPEWAKTPYPAVLCTSVNDEIAHGIPNDYQLKEGDIITLDVGIKIDGVCGDCAITLPVGEIDSRNERLLRYSNRAVYMGAQEVRAGAHVVDVAKAIEKYALQMGFTTVVTFSGHGIGETMHESDITIPNFTDYDVRYVQRFAGQVLKAGDVICIEPMLTYKDRYGKIDADGWTTRTKDGKNCAMFEHMILVKEDGYEILTDHFEKI